MLPVIEIRWRNFASFCVAEPTQTTPKTPRQTGTHSLCLLRPSCSIDGAGTVTLETRSANESRCFPYAILHKTTPSHRCDRLRRYFTAIPDHAAKENVKLSKRTVAASRAADALRSVHLPW